MKLFLTKTSAWLYSVLCLSAFPAAAQIVTISPRFPRITDSLEIIYDASKGSMGLKDSGEVYIHTGIVTGGPNATGWSNVPMAWGSADPRWRMTNLGNNKFRFRMRPTTFYPVSPGTTVYRLGMVFRNRTGSATGKTANGEDIFMPVYQPGQQALQFLSLENRFFMVPINGVVPYTGASSFLTGLQVWVNGELAASVSNDSTISGSVPSSTGGNKKVILRSTTNAALRDSFTVRVDQPLDVQALPPGIEDGISVVGPGSVVLCLRAPFKSSVHVIGEFNNWEISDASQMKRTPDGKFWWIQLDNLNPSTLYAFQYLVDGTLRIADPYSKIILDQSNDGFITSSVYPGLKPYPNGKTTGLVSVFQTTENNPYEWQNNNFRRPDKKDLVVYELLIRDFGNAKTYKNLTDTLMYLKKLGVNCIQLMPVMEFEGNLSWGYNPSHHYALDKFYGTANAFKAFVDKAHGLCMAVVLDIAMNHAFGQNPMVRLYWNAALNRPSAQSPWFNEVPKHDFNVGFDFNHSTPDTRYYTDRVMKFWLDEYRIDGFRWDLSKGFTQVNSLGNVGQWGAYDASRIAIWKNLYDDMQSYSPCSYCILEHFADNSEERELANYGMMFWGNLNHAYTEAVMGWTGTSDLSWGYHRSRNWQNPNLITYMESHDEERLMYKSLQYGNQTQQAQGYNLRDTTTILERIKLASTFFYTIPGPKMLWQFGEMGYGFSINWPCANPCTNGANRTGQKPIRWDYLNEPRRRSLWNVTRSLIALKRFEPVFGTMPATSALSVGGQAMKRIILTHESRNVVVLGNFGVTTATITPNFPGTGRWYDFFTGDSIEVSNPSAGITLSRGEYRLYSNIKWKSPAEYQEMLLASNCPRPAGTDACGNVLSTPETETLARSIRLYPNPGKGRFQFSMPHFREGSSSLRLMDVRGRVVWSSEINVSGGEGEFNLENAGLTPGLYFIQVRSGGHRYASRLILEP